MINKFSTTIVICILSFQAFSADLVECGQSGSVESRIKECNAGATDQKGIPWDLVYYKKRSIGPRMILQNTQTKVLWTTNFLSTQDFAIKTCDTGIDNALTGNLPLNWKVASVEDYKNILASGAWDFLELKGYGAQYWIDIEDKLIDLNTWKFLDNDHSNGMPVMCVAKP